jgi:hypothetical protein
VDCHREIINNAAPLFILAQIKQDGARQAFAARLNATVDWQAYSYRRDFTGTI